MPYLTTKIYALSTSSSSGWSRAPHRAHTHTHTNTKNAQMVLAFARFFFFPISTRIFIKVDFFVVCLSLFHTRHLCRQCAYVIVCGFHCHYDFSCFLYLEQSIRMAHWKPKTKINLLPTKKAKREITERRTHFCCIPMYGELITYDLLKTEHNIRTRYMRLFCVLSTVQV